MATLPEHPCLGLPIDAERIDRALSLNDMAIGVPLFASERPLSGSNYPWRVTPTPFCLPAETLEQIEALGQHLLTFYRAANSLYFKSAKGLAPAFIAQYLDQGKPEDVIDMGRRNRTKSQLPAVIRPDLLLTDHGLIASELDSVPGGMGFTAFLSQAYHRLGDAVVGGADGMVDGFIAMCRSASGKEDPVVAVIISDESESYRAEMSWLVEHLKAKGMQAQLVHPREVKFQETGLLLSDDTPIDLVYRFFELFDLRNIPKAELILYAHKKGQVRMTPPPKAFLEEKMWFALFHHPALQTLWQQELGPKTHQVLKGILPRTWLVDPRPLPPHATIPGITVSGQGVQDWRDLLQASKKERPFVLKPSGFSEMAWGSRGVVFADDISADAWEVALEQALAAFPKSPHILQEFHRSKQFQVEHLNFATGELATFAGRARLCPYYYVVGEEAKLAGILATVAPADKRAIHGMSDAIMSPVVPRKRQLGETG